MIYAGDDLNAVQQKRETTLENIRLKCKSAIIRDTAPGV